ncbi:MAG: tRNA-binding protein [Humidesulfovibrio sp.]|uniref:tRNA-binding protein n=1 Tax=Humidesulfovibrio sp. TaxID=2910988 RepID=UPI0027E6BD5C|nr:tRNA-binding protein [Humidesulfovibrio sp.]MDQ7836014.1 tRNA-binding protein [Humidesulfovibrio sp.]
MLKTTCHYEENMELPQAPDCVSVEDFFRINIRVGTVLRAETFPEAKKPAYKLWIDFGDLGVRQSSAQITQLYQPEELVGRQIVAVVNFPPRKIAGFRSEVLVLGAATQDGTITLLAPDAYAPDGERIH